MQAVKNLVSSATSKSQYLTGDKAGIDAFIDRFDVSCLPSSSTGLSTLTIAKVFLFDCDGTTLPPPTTQTTPQHPLIANSG